MNPKQSDLVYTYYVDAGCQIISVDENWESFARENGAEVLVDNVVGKSLLQFISNPEVCAIYQMLLDQVLTTQNAVTVTLRCDSAELRREMELQVIPLSNSLAKFAC